VANCCPGLEVDFRAVWRRMFEGLELREYDNMIVRADGPLARLARHRLLAVRLPDAPAETALVPVMNQIRGQPPSDPEQEMLLTTSANPFGLAPLEWSNALARVLAGYQGREVECLVSTEVAGQRLPLVEEPPNYEVLRLRVRAFFEPGTAVIAAALAQAGELTQGLCSPWQNDYRECSCYYWASARPDFVNVEPGPDGLSAGDNWLQKRRTGRYVPDDYVDARLVFYDDLFDDWEKWLRFQVGGRDLPGEAP